MKRLLTNILLLLCVVSPAFGDEARDSLKAAQAALNSKDYAGAIAHYEKARELMPANAAIPYNLGVAHYRAGDFSKAAEAFEQAMQLSKDDTLRSNSIYNMGNAAYAKSLEALGAQGDASKPMEQLNQATDLLKQAFETYKKAIDANPTDADAKANAELSHRLLKLLQEMQQQMQQQQQQSSDQQDQDQKDEQKQDQNQQQNKQQEQNQDQQQQSSEQQDKNEQQQQQNQPQSSQEQNQNDSQPQQQQEQQRQDAAGEDEKQQQEESQPQAAEQEPKEQQPKPAQAKPGDKDEKQRMTKEQVERLLQSVRDKERKRRAGLAQREAMKYAPVEKDW